MGSLKGLDALSRRQREVLSLVTRGLTNAGIAGVLGISPSTVKRHVENLLRVLDVTNRTELAAFAHLAEQAEHIGHGPAAAFADRPAVAVLRLDADPDDASAVTFAAGLGDDLIALLCKWRWFPVISRGTSFYYDSHQPTSVLREQIGATYFIGGTVSRRGERVRVTMYLDDAERNHCLWSDRFDLPVSEIFALQDEIAGIIIGRAYPELLRAAGRAMRGDSPATLAAWELAHDGWIHLDRGPRASVAGAIDLFDRALHQDPRYVLPLYGKGMALFERITNQWTDSVASDCAAFERCAEEAIRIDEHDASGWVLAGRSALTVGDSKRALEPLERAVTLNWSHARAHSLLGQAYVGEGNRKGFEHLRLALRLSPRQYSGSFAFAHFAFGEYDEAARYWRAEIANRPAVFPRAVLCASLALGGDTKAAKIELARLVEDHPSFRLEGLLRIVPPGRHDVSDRLAEGLRRAGLQA